MKLSAIRHRLAETNPVLFIEKQIQRYARNGHTYRRNVARLLELYATEPRFTVPPHYAARLRDRFGSIDLNVRQPGGIVGLVVTKDPTLEGESLVHPLEARLVNISDHELDRQLPFTRDDVIDFLGVLTEALAPEYRSGVRSLRFDIRNRLAGIDQKGISMTAAASLAVLQALSPDADELPPTCVLIDCFNNELRRVNDIGQKLAAFVREYGDTGLIIYDHVNSPEAQPFRPHFSTDNTYDIASFRELLKFATQRRLARGLTRYLPQSAAELASQLGLGQSAIVTGEFWLRLVSGQTRASKDLLKKLEPVCRSDPDNWKAYFSATRNYVDSGNLRLADLKMQVEWLQTCRPTSETSKALDLMAAATDLILANHAGNFDPLLDSEVTRLSDECVEEEPDLVHWIDLHRAVADTNRFEFHNATRRLTRLRESQTRLNYRGRYWSSLGQHAAFQLDPETAEKHFQKAIALFKRLDHNAARELSQTTVYRALAAMDDPARPDNEIRELLGDALCTPCVEEAIMRLAGSGCAEEVYRHHTLLRFLCRHGKDNEKQAYLAQQAHWHNLDATDHPRECIHFYRAWLLHEAQRPGWQDELTHALQALAVPHPTIKMIASTFATIGVSWGVPWPRAEATLASLTEQLPAARERLRLLRSAVDSPADPWTLLDAVIPFNFH